jgi:hypothetical protein
MSTWEPGHSVDYRLIITGKLAIFSLPLPVKILPVTDKFKGLKLDLFTIFYLKLAGKTAQSVKDFDRFFLKLQFSSINRHFPLNFF